MTKAVNRRIFQFAYFLWNEASVEKRCSDTNNFLKVSSSLQLIGSTPLMERWICKEENDFQKKARTSKPTNNQLAKNGMVSPSRGRYESYLQWWEDGKKRLYVHGDVENAARLIIRRFLTLTARRSRMIYPSIANTVMILEHQMTACLALYTRLSLEHRYPICLPGSYLTMVRFWDDFRPNVDKGTFTLYQAVDRNASQELNKLRLLKAVCSILSYMVRLTCGDLDPSFDVLGDALCSDGTPMYISSGEAERTLVLFLAMVCNCGKGIPTSVEDVMLRKMCNLKPYSHFPSSIKDALEGIQVAKGCSDIVEILQMFLQSRGEELYDLRWHNDKLWFDGPSNPSSYRQRFHIDISILRDELSQDEQQVPGEALHDTAASGSEDVDLDRPDFEATTESMEVKYTDEELKEKEKARLEVIVTNMQRLYRRSRQAKALRSRKLSRLKSIEEHTKPSADVLEEHFSRFRVDKTACGICGTHFKASTDEHLLISHVEDYPEVTNQQTEETTPDEEIESAEAHKKSLFHLQKEQEFQKYKDLYLAEIHPCLVKDDELQKTVEDVPSSGIRKRMDGVAIDLERLERCRSTVNSEVQSIESTLDWTNTRSLWSAVKEFKVKLQNMDKLLEQAKADWLIAEHEDDETEEHISEEDEEIVEMHQDEGKKRKKHKKHRRRRTSK